MNDLNSLGKYEIRTIPGFDKYVCDSLGNVYAIGPKGNSRKNREIMETLNPFKKKNGYLGIKIKNNSGAQKHKLIHQLVLMAFCGESTGLECNHIDGNKQNNSISNLEWVTRSQNNLHKARVLKKTFRRKTKVTEEKHQSILEMRSLGMTYSKIANILELDESWVHRIVNGRAWKRDRVQG